jgi:hypothetical protein
LVDEIGLRKKESRNIVPNWPPIWNEADNVRQIIVILHVSHQDEGMEVYGGRKHRQKGRMQNWRTAEWIWEKKEGIESDCK